MSLTTLQTLRGSGRTRAMLRDAAEQIHAGRPAIIVVAHREMVSVTTEQILGHLEDLGHDPDRQPTRFAVVAYEPKLIDWDAVRCPRYESVYPGHTLYVPVCPQRRGCYAAL